MITRYQHKSLTWFDVVSPTIEEVHELIDECRLPLVLATDLTAMTPRSDIIATKSALKLTLDYPIVKRTDINHPHEIKFIATKHHLITIRFEDMEALHRFARGFEVITMLRAGTKKPSGGHLLLTLMKHLYAALITKLDYLETRIADIEEGIFNDQEKEMVFEISKINRRLITFRQTIATHESVLEHLEADMAAVFSQTLAASVKDIRNEFTLVGRKLRSLSHTLDELRETNNSLLTTKQNEIMKTLTIIAFTTFPLTLLSSVFGMNTQKTPIVGHRGDFWIIVGIMALVSATFFMFFRYKKWM